MGNCSACLSRGYSIHDMASSEEEEQEELGGNQVGDMGLKSSAVIKVVRVTDGEVLEYETANGGNDMRAHNHHHYHHRPGHKYNVLRAKDVISRVGGGYGLFEGRSDSSHGNSDKSTKELYTTSEPLHPETPLDQQSRVYYLRPWPATGAPAAPINNSGAVTNTKAPRAGSRKKVRFSDDVASIPSSSASLGRRSLHAEDHDHAANNQSNNVVNVAAGRPVVRVKVLLSKRQLCGLLASDNSAAANSLLVDQLVAPLLPPHLAQQLHVATSGAPAQPHRPSLLSQLQQATRQYINPRIET